MQEKTAKARVNIIQYKKMEKSTYYKQHQEFRQN